jgi:hypothetical protein
MENKKMTKWIPITETLPRLYLKVLVIDKQGNIGIGQYWGHGEFSHSSYPVAGQVFVTHWMPLPTSPTSKEDNYGTRTESH